MRWRSGRLIGWVASVAAVALIVTLAVVSSGFDSRETPREDPSVWVMRASGQYARVNTVTAEIDTVRIAESPSGLVQTDGLSLLLTQGYGRAWEIDPTNPQDIRDEGDETTVSAVETPVGTRQVLASGGRVLYLTESGQVYLALSGRPEATIQLDVSADAAAIDAAGRVAVYSRAEGGVLWFDGASGEPRRALAELPGELPGTDAQLAIVDGGWVILDTDRGVMLREGDAEPVELDLADGPLLQDSGQLNDGDGRVYVADQQGLIAVTDQGPGRVVDAAGTPARPRLVDDDYVAAWVGANSATMWSSEGGTVPLDIDSSVEQITDPVPVIRSSGERAVLAETTTGLIWRAPDGQSIPLAQWNLTEPPKEEAGKVVTQDVTEQEPPVAVDDRFGVRAGEPALLPVLLNDFDPNRKDVLTIVPEGLGEGLADEFGDVELLADGQAIVLQVSSAAQGSAQFSYRITDGVHLSPPATVTVSVADDGENSAPQWCPVEGCQRSWPSPEITPGGTLVMPLLEGWVDPQSDPMTLRDVEAIPADAPVRALVTEDGQLALRHTDSNASEGEVTVRLTVADARGEATERDLRVRVAENASAEFAPMASTIAVGERATLNPLDRLTGGSGAFGLVDAVVQANLTGSTQSNTVTSRVKQGIGAIELTADRVGSAIVAVTMRDAVTEQEISGIIRVTVVEERQRLALPPMRAFVRPLADSTVEVLNAIPNAHSRPLSVQSATVVGDSLSSDNSRLGTAAEGSLRADVIEHARIRVSGSTSDGLPGRIGAIDVTVAEGSSIATGRLTVFQVGGAAHGAIAVADSATVRAGSVVDIPVLGNDIAPPGERLLLSPDVSGSGEAGELAFASGNRLRYLAPETAGTYVLSYSAYSAGSPELSDSAQVRVTVLPSGSNRNPEPELVTARVAPGEQVNVSIPLSGVDPDGDRVRLLAVEAAADPQLSTSLVSRSNSVQVTASRSAAPGASVIGYTVRDDYGGEARGELRVIVTEPNPAAGAPVAYSDYVRITAPNDSSDEPTHEAVVRPLDNDLDPSGGELEIVKVVPNVAGSTGSAEYLELARRLDPSGLKQGVLRITGSDRPGTVSYRYTVRSKQTTSTADGLIVVHTATHVGRQAPNIADTILSVSDRSTLENGGIDVVTGQVRWATGDVSQLKLSLWGVAKDHYSLAGNKIVGSYRPQGDLVTFRLAGVDSAGGEVESFGFLIVPPIDELRLTLKPGLAPITVGEGQSVDVDVREILDLGSGDRVVLANDSFTVQRGQARCFAPGEQTIRYVAGSGSPWSDTCTIRVRLSEQRSYTSLPVRISVIPREPVAVLNPLTRTVPPGSEERVNLLDMLEWEGGREGRLNDLRWSVSGGGSLFDLERDGSTLRVRAHADAAPGLQETVNVSVTGGSTNRLILRVGEAAQDAPRGGTVSLQCTVGSPCSAPLVGVPGEYDPFAGAPGGGLEVVSLDSAGCAVAELRVEGDAVRASWANDRAPGGTCTATFTVRDAQDRVGTGTVEFDAQGIPRAPSSIATVAYTESSVTLRVTPGEAAHPAVTRVLLRQVGTSNTTQCTADGANYLCEVTGLPLGERRSYTAVAVNEVGESAASSQITTWAYRPPAAPTVTAEQQAGGPPGSTTENRGTVRFVISGQSDVKEYRVVLNGTVFATLPGSSVDTSLSVPVGAHSLRVVPVSRFGSPIDGGDTGTAVSRPLTVAGIPVLGEPTTSYDADSERLTVTVEAGENLGGALSYGAAIGDSCSVTNSSNIFELPLSATDGQSVRITVCAENTWGTNARTTDIIIELPEAGGTP